MSEPGREDALTPRTHELGVHPHHHAGARRISWVLLGLISVWGLLMRQVGGADMYAVLGPYALAVSCVLWLLRGRSLRARLAPSAAPVLNGLIVGGAMTIATYAAFDLLSAFAPALEARVEDLYRSAHTASLPIALLWVAVIILAEELLWRGVLLEALERRFSPFSAALLSVATYTLAQLGSGSWIVAAAAAVCGAIWTAQRKWTDSLLAPLIAHLIWTPTVILIHPVTG